MLIFAYIYSLWCLNFWGGFVQMLPKDFLVALQKATL